jgi:GNAT superfamily N-acetyltransferase
MPERREIKGIVIREATMQDVNLFEDRQLFLERMEQGHRCFMGIEESTGKLTNYRWICDSAPYIPEIDRYLMLTPGGAYAYDLNTLPEFRRRGIDAFTRHYAYSYLRDTGYAKVYAYIHGDNGPSLRASRVLLRPVGRIWYVRPRGCNPIVIGTLKPGFPELRRFASDDQIPQGA